MAENKAFVVKGENGVVGTLLARARFLDDAEHKVVKLASGEEVVVPKERLEPLPDGSFYLHPGDGQEMSLAPQEPAVSAEPVEEAQNNGHKDSVTEVNAQSRFRDDCEVERVTVNKFVDAPAETRQEGDVMIVPLMEEVWVVEKRLMVREELRIRRKREQVVDPPTVGLTDGKRVRYQS